MDETISFKKESPAVGVCPKCGKRGKSVGRQTVRALVSDSLRAVQEGTNNFFCRTEFFPTVYITCVGHQTFNVDQTQEYVCHKEPDNDRVLICYCFQHTLGNIKTATLENRLAIIEDIKTGIKAGMCGCDLRNPQGSCCTGNIQALIHRMQVDAFTSLPE